VEEGSVASDAVSRNKAELLKDVLLLALLHSFTSIVHDHYEQLLHWVILEAHFNNASKERVLERIRNQVHSYLLDSIGVTKEELWKDGICSRV
jgi:hypothetical protein